MTRLNSSRQCSQGTLPRPLRRYERLIGIALKHNLIATAKLRDRAIYHLVETLHSKGMGRCSAMEHAADELCCSYSLARLAVYEVEKQQSIFKQMNPQIKIKNEVDCTVIDIEGTIGLSEEWQFDNPESRVATYERFKECVASIADIRNTKIVVNIRSTGGDVNDALLIYEALRSTGAHVTTRCYGYTASAATIVAQAASEGCREMASTSLYLIHKSLCSTEGNAEELQAEVEMLRQTDLRIAEVYAQRSGRSVEEMSELMSANGGRGRWLSPDEAIAEGLVDRYVSQESAEAEKNSLAKRSKQGVKALLKALGIDTESEPNVDDDINYIPRAVVHNDVEASASPITLGEGQKSAKPTTLRSVQDPSPLSECHDARSIAYERDAQIIKMR